MQKSIHKLHTNKSLPSGFWKSPLNQRKFLDHLALKLNIKNPCDWGNVSVQNFRDAGGTTLIKNFNNSIFNCLQSVYKDTEWKREWFSIFPKSYWESMDNRRKFLDNLAKELDIKNPSDWGTVNQKTFYNHGGSTLLRNYYNSSIFGCLQSVYKDIQWKREWFPNVSNSHWRSKINQKKLLDDIADKLDIKTPRDWGKVTIKQVNAYGGNSLLIRYYKGSLFACLCSVYDDIEWKREWFPELSKFPKMHWESYENCRKFMDDLAFDFNIETSNNWRRISASIVKNRGASGLLSKYGNSMKSLLKAIYPSHDWNLLPQEGRISTELHLQGLVESVFPTTVFVHQRKHKLFY